MGDVRKAANYPHNSKALVLDISGGDQLPGTDNKNPIRAPGETLLMDRSGNWWWSMAWTDVDAYRRFVFPEVKERSNQSCGRDLRRAQRTGGIWS